MKLLNISDFESMTDSQVEKLINKNEQQLKQITEQNFLLKPKRKP